MTFDPAVELVRQRKQLEICTSWCWFLCNIYPFDKIFMSIFVLST